MYIGEDVVVRYERYAGLQSTKHQDSRHNKKDSLLRANEGQSVPFAVLRGILVEMMEMVVEELT